MAGTMLEVRVNDKEVVRRLEGISLRGRNILPVFRNFGERMKDSIQKNFDVGGRPKKWPPSIRARVEGGKTLVDSARLKNSITYEAGSDYLKVGTNVIYGAIHQFGGTIRPKKAKALRFVVAGMGVTTKKAKIPARPFLLFQDSDIDYFIRHLQQYLLTGSM